MNRRISLIATLALAAVAIVLVMKRPPTNRPETPPTAIVVETNQPTGAHETPAQPATEPVGLSDATAAPPVKASTPAAPAIIAQKIEVLQQLAMNSDADSLNAILAELTNSSPDIRAAAREAAVQFGNVSAVPSLRQAAAQMEDLDEKVALLEAAKYLELPSFPVTSSTNLHPSGITPPARP